MKRLFNILILSVLIFGGCTTNQVQETTSQEQVQEEIPSSTKQIFAMDTYMTVTAYGTNAEEATTKAEERINELDELLSTGSEDSEVSKLNQAGKATLSADTAILMQKSLDLYQETGGAFNVAIYPIMQAWGFTTGDYKVPAESELQQLLSLTDVNQISYDSQTKEVEFLMDGMEIDFGGIAKGYTSSEIMDIFKECGIESGLVSLGGNVQTLGYKTDGSQWRVAVQNPDETEDYLGVLETHDKAVITSGGYERYFEEDGKTYHHIIDTETGFPAQNGLTSVTIVSSDGMLADGLSTSLFVMGLEKASEFWKEHSDEFDAILLTEDGELYVTEGISDEFTSDLTINLIRR
jgi:thiamine biosynthesis lipoprotein